MERRRQPSLVTRLVLHPFLFASFPVLFLFAQNLEEDVVFRELLPPLAWVLGSVAALMFVGWLAVRDLKIVGLVVSAWALLFLSYGHAATAVAQSRVAGSALGRDTNLLSIWAALAVGSVVVAVLVRRRLAGITQGLNVVAAFLIVMNVAPIALHEPPPAHTARGLGRGGAPPHVVAAARTRRLPDIYYIIPDRYGTWKMHKRTYRINTRPFIQFLKQKGFYVASSSLANYGSTHQSLAASLHMEYIDTLLPKGTIPKKSVVYGLLRNFTAVQFLKSLGYRYVRVSHYRPTKNDPLIDLDITAGDWGEFANIFYATTVLPAVSRVFDVAEEQLDPRRRSWTRTLEQFEQVARMRYLRGPKLVLAHFFLPHEPYVFDRNGRFVPKEQRKRRSWRIQYSDQVIFANKKLRELINSLLSNNSNPPVIIVQADEGHWPLRYWGRSQEFDYQSATRTEILDKFEILNAYYFPGIRKTHLYPSITPVNSFRLIFNLYFGAQFRLLRDVAYGRERSPYRFIEITDLLRTPTRKRASSFAGDR
jgi:hypothetical protein